MRKLANMDLQTTKAESEDNRHVFLNQHFQQEQIKC